METNGVTTYHQCLVCDEIFQQYEDLEQHCKTHVIEEEEKTEDDDVLNRCDRPAKRARTDLTLDVKQQLIADFEKVPRPTQKELAVKYSIGRTTVSDILKRKDEYKEKFANNFNSSKKRFYFNTKFEDISRRTYEWYVRARSKNISISGPKIQTKALSFANETNCSEFKASDGWLTSWKDRYNVRTFKISGESVAVDPDTVEDPGTVGDPETVEGPDTVEDPETVEGPDTVDVFRVRIPSIVEGYSQENIFNCDETSLFFRALPDGTLCDNKISGKNSKEQLTILFCCSAAGEKLKPLVIGVAENPPCFKGVDKNNLSVNWSANSKASMTSAIYSDWLEELNREMRRQQRHILLFIDDAPSHICDTYSNIIIKIFPPNTTSVLQPMNQGIIRAFKTRYRHNMMSHLITRIDKYNKANDLVKQITVLDAIHWIVKSWTETTVSTITKCFQQCGFDVPADDEKRDIPLAKLIELLVPSSKATEEDFINLDDEILTKCNEEDDDEHVISNEDEDDMSTDLTANRIYTVQGLTHAKCLHILNDLKTFAQSNDVGLVESIRSLEDRVQDSALRYSNRNQKQSS